MALQVAVQVYSVRDVAEKDMAGALRAIKEMGYAGVELAGLYGHSADYVKGLLDGLGLIPVSAHVPLEEMLADPDATFAAYATIGVQFIAVPHVGEERRPNSPLFEQLIKEVAMLGEIAKKYGIQLLYHNHDFEFRKIGEEYGLDYIYRNISPEYLQTEIDTCWVNIAGEVPAEYVLKYTGRAPVVHLKDFYKSGETKGQLYVFVGEDESTRGDNASVFEFRPNGHGMQDIPAITAAAEKAGAKWVVVEQDMPSMGLSSMESIKTSREYLKSIGL